MTRTVGSLCSGYEGLGLGLGQVLDTATAWVSEVDPSACAVLDARLPGVPNLGDLTAVDWSTVDRVDVLSAGYPCQPFSTAGRRKGTADARHLWPFIADAIGVLRPRLVVLENVAGHLSLGFDSVLADLARLGYDARWTVVRASDVGACHRRARLFIVATTTSGAGRREVARGTHGDEETPRSWARGDDLPVRDGAASGTDGRVERTAAADTAEPERRDPQPNRLGASSGPTAEPRERTSARPATDAGGMGRRPGTGLRPNGSGGLGGRRPSDDRGQDAPHAHQAGPQGAQSTPRRDVPDWGAYGPAIARHAGVVGRPAPHPVDGRGRLNPPFVEWMMMLPAGWVTDVVTNRSKALKCLGNGVVPPQAAFALRRLLSTRSEAAA